MIEQIFQRIVIMSLTGSMLTALLLLLRKLTSRFFGSRWHYCTYIAAMLVFLIPLSLKLPDSRSANNDTDIGQARVFFMPIEADDSTSDNVEITIKQAEKTSVKNELWRIYLAASDYIPYVWLCGFCIYFVFSVSSHILFVLRVKRNSVYSDRKSGYGKRSLKIAKSGGVSSPVIVGVVFPTLYLPEREISDEDFHNILSHESVHLRRHDIEIKWLCLFARSVHWFNPFIHVLSRIISKECEISCDIEVTKDMDKIEIASYCETILSLVTVKDETASMTSLGMGSTKKTLERRFKAIMENKKTGKKFAVISVAAACVIILSAFTVSALLAGSSEKEPVKKGEYVSGNEIEAVKENDADRKTEYDAVDTENEYELIPYSNGEKRVHPVYGVEVDDVETDGVQISADFNADRHPAVDYKLEAGTVITSPIEGTVATAEYNYEKGNHIMIEGLDGTSTILFAHLEKMYVNAGDKVNAGDTLGTVGSTGMSTGPHLHVEYTENGEAQNPVSIIIVEENGKISALYSQPKLIEVEENENISVLDDEPERIID